MAVEANISCEGEKKSLERNRSGLEYLDKSICDQFLKPYVFNSVVSIFSDRDLSNNQLNDLPKGIFSNNTHLIWL